MAAFQTLGLELHQQYNNDNIILSMAYGNPFWVNREIRRGTEISHYTLTIIFFIYMLMNSCPQHQGLHLCYESFPFRSPSMTTRKK